MERNEWLAWLTGQPWRLPLVRPTLASFLFCPILDFGVQCLNLDLYNYLVINLLICPWKAFGILWIQMRFMSKDIQKLFKHVAQNHQMKAIQTDKLYSLYCTLITWLVLIFYWLWSTVIKQLFELSLESPIEDIKKGYVVKMSAALLLLMNSLCQMLDTACVSRVLLKNDCICMTKADGFRVLRREGGVGGLKGGRRQETVWDSWTDALGLLALSQSGDQKLCWICWILKPRH